MNKTLGIALLLFVFSSTQAQKQPVDLVNVFTGTSNSRWQLFPGASMPFGMVKLSPDNQENVWNGGYEYTIGSISGFSFIHAMSLSGLSIMPVPGSAYAKEGWVRTYPGPADGPFGGMWTAGYRSRFKKETEHASPGYYTVELLDDQIKAELTSTMRCGMIRLWYPSGEAHLVLNFDFPTEEKTEILETHFEKIGDRDVRGFIRQKNGYVPAYTVYFVLHLNKPIGSADAWDTEPYHGEDNNYGTAWRQKRTLKKDIKKFDGKAGSGVLLNFTTAANEPVLVSTGISFVSMEQAGLNFETELRPLDLNFEKVVRSNRGAWNDLLKRVEVYGSSEEDKAKFYTNLYRCYSGKSVMNDVDGRYTDACQKTQQISKKDQNVYSSDGLWGTQWELTPVWTLISPGVAESFVHSLLELADKGGWIPAAPVGLGYSPIMGAQHQNSLIISSWQKGIRGFDSSKAFQAILHDYTTPGENYPCGGFAGNRHQRSYMDLGYVPDETGAASNTMEYAYDDWCFSQFAEALGKEDVYKLFAARSKNYKNLFDPQSRYIRRRHADGTFVEPFDPDAFGTQGGWNGKGFMEGTAFQYSFFVPHDVDGMITLMGRDTFVNRLENGFIASRFDLGNQPSLEAPFLFNYAGKPWLTQKYTRKITATMFDTSPYQGWVGEEDEGQMGAYYVLLSMGLFEMDGGCAVKPYYNLSTPVFDKIILHLDDHFYPGKAFTILASNNKKGNSYIQSATLNGRILNRCWLYHQEIADGGVLIYQLGPVPNKSWGLDAHPH